MTQNARHRRIRIWKTFSSVPHNRVLSMNVFCWSLRQSLQRLSAYDILWRKSLPDGKTSAAVSPNDGYMQSFNMDTADELSSLQVVAVDCNPAQSALLELKAASIRYVSDSLDDAWHFARESNSGCSIWSLTLPHAWHASHFLDQSVCNQTSKILLIIEEYYS